MYLSLHRKTCKCIQDKTIYSASEFTAPPSLSGNLRSIQERKDGTSSAILLGREELVMNRGILPLHQSTLEMTQNGTHHRHHYSLPSSNLPRPHSQLPIPSRPKRIFLSPYLLLCPVWEDSRGVRMVWRLYLSTSL